MTCFYGLTYIRFYGLIQEKKENPVSFELGVHLEFHHLLKVQVHQYPVPQTDLKAWFML